MQPGPFNWKIHTAPPGVDVDYLVPGVHRVFTRIPQEAKAGDQVDLMYVRKGQTAQLIGEPITTFDGTLFFRVLIQDQGKPLACFSENQDPKSFDPKDDTISLTNDKGIIDKFLDYLNGKPEEPGKGPDGTPAY